MVKSGHPGVWLTLPPGKSLPLEKPQSLPSRPDGCRVSYGGDSTGQLSALPHEASAIIVPILQMRKWTLKEVADVSHLPQLLGGTART